MECVGRGGGNAACSKHRAPVANYFSDRVKLEEHPSDNGDEQRVDMRQNGQLFKFF